MVLSADRVVVTILNDWKLIVNGGRECRIAIEEIS